jgi:hypothetical protein
VCLFKNEFESLRKSESLQAELGKIFPGASLRFRSVAVQLFSAKSAIEFMQSVRHESPQIDQTIISLDVNAHVKNLREILRIPSMLQSTADFVIQSSADGILLFSAPTSQELLAKLRISVLRHHQLKLAFDDISQSNRVLEIDAMRI